VRLAFGCTDGTTASAIREARRLVEGVGVHVLIGPLSGEEEDAVIDYARVRPDVAFVNGSSSSQELDPPANFFTFHSDGAQWMAGLGTYAYRTLGWRRAVIVGDLQGAVFNWATAAGFAGEFCSLGGTIARRIWVPPGTQDYTNVIAQMPAKGVDGIFAATPAATFIALAKGYPGLRGNFSRRMLPGGVVFDPSLNQLGKRL
jgi:branched-chain amino acid transport system substrate-binding protein